jgi:hypothetical protein
MLKKQTVEIGGRKIDLVEMSASAAFRMIGEEKPDISKRYIECLAEKDKLVFDELNSAEGVELMKSINKLNGWDSDPDEKKKNMSSA